MKKLLITGLLYLLGCCSLHVWAQPGLDGSYAYLQFSNAAGAPGDTVFVDVKAFGFKDVLTLQFGVNWDTQVLEFQSVRNILLEASSYGVTPNNVQFGLLPVVWVSPSSRPITITDGYALFRIYFIIKKDSPGFSPVWVSNGPFRSELLFQEKVGSSIIAYPAISYLGGMVAVQNTPEVAGLLRLEAPGIQLADPADCLGSPGEGIQIRAASGMPPYDLRWIKNGLVLGRSDSLAIQGKGFYEVEIKDQQHTLFAGFYFADTCQGVVRQVALSFDSVVASPGERICVPLRSQEIVNLAGAQLGISWDTAVLRFDTAFTGGPAWQFGLHEGVLGGEFRAFLLPITGGEPFYPTQEGAALFTMCFETVGDLGQSTLVRIDSSILEPIVLGGREPSRLDIAFQPGLVVLQSGKVWPGDTDVNGRVNHYDVLNIGLAFGQNGPGRENASTDWKGQTAPDWNRQAPGSNIDLKHVDADGNGLISRADAGAIEQHWTQEVPDGFSPVSKPEEKREGVVFYLDVDTLQAGLSYKVPLILGEASKPAENIYGLAFSVIYDSRLLKDDMRLVLDDSWLGNAQDLLMVQRNFPEEGRLEAGITRLDGQPVNGFGPVAELNITIEDVILRDQKPQTYFRLEQVRLIDPSAVRIPAETPDTQPVVQQDQVNNIAEPEWAQGLRITPQPANERIHVQLYGEVWPERLELRNMQGQLLQSVNRQSYIEVAETPSGLYFLQIKTNKGQVARLVVIQ